MVKQFKVRIEGLTPDIHAMEMWIKADSIIDVARDIMSFFAANGIEPHMVTKIIEVDAPVNTGRCTAYYRDYKMAENQCILAPGHTGRHGDARGRDW